MKRILWIMTFLSALMVLTIIASASSVTIKDLGSLPGATGSTILSVAFSINDKEQIVGHGRTSTGQDHACYWENSSSVPGDLGTLEGIDGTSPDIEGYDSIAFNINTNGQIVGSSTTDFVSGMGKHYYLSHACYWENGSSVPKALKTLGGTQGEAYAINDKGQIVGVSQTSSGFWHACYWENSNSVPKDLVTPGDTEYSNARSINNIGQIVGRSYYWENSNSVPKVLKIPGGEQSEAYAINDKGQIVGERDTSSGNWHACYWENSSSVPEDLGGGSQNYAISINKNAQIVGSNYTSSGFWHACYWENSSSVLEDLGTLPGGSHSNAISINKNMQIVGSSDISNGAIHACLWTVKEPLSNDSSLSALIISKGSLYPAFSSGTMTYTDTVDNGVSSVIVTPTANECHANIKVNGQTVTSGQLSQQIELNEGQNKINVVVTAQDSKTQKTYTITVNREPSILSSNNKLSALTISKGTLVPKFSSRNTMYKDTVANKISSVIVTPTASDNTAKITVNGAYVLSGRASKPIKLRVGANNIEIGVIAQNGSKKTYTVVVIRSYK